ncbi:hypothetical protein BGZ98_001906 [Dissophora globulifera]|nr:hypothetical protein BGZ98_001906 [Dissophora globulifera]
MNPNAASFTPSFAKSGGSDYAASDHSGDNRSRRSTVDLSREALVSGLGISSPTGEQSPHHSLTVNTKVFSPNSLLRQDRSTFSATEMSPRQHMSSAALNGSHLTMMGTSSSSAAPHTSAALTAGGINPAVPADFNPEEFRINLMRQISDQLESGLDRHFLQLVSATTAALPLSPATSDTNDGTGAGGAAGSSSGSLTNNSSDEMLAVQQLKKLLRTTTAELERVKGKNQELRDANHKLELQRMEATHQVARLQDFEVNNQFLQSRVKELESCASSIDSMETSSMNGHRGQQQHQRNGSTASASNTQLSQHVQRLMREVASLTAERDALKIKSWELEKKPYAQQHQQRPAHFVDLENERNRLVEELGAKTVATEDLWNKNEALMVRAKEYEKRVWELEGQCSALEEECGALPKLRSDLVEMEARAVAADALVEKLQDMEGQVALVKSLQDRIHELETTNAELEHSNWDLAERLNIANNQHALLTKEFESFRSKDTDGRRLEFLMTKNRELEALLSEQAKISPDYKDEYERVSTELEKVKLRVPQLEGQAKQVALLRSKTLQLEKQIKTMEELEPRLEEIQKLHERNLFLEGELGELEHLRAREMELESELDETKARLTQLETSKSRMASLSGIRSPGTRARSGSVAQPPYNPALFQDGDESFASLNIRSGSPIQQPQPQLQNLSRRTSQSISSGSQADFGNVLPMSPTRAGTATVSAWPSGRSSMMNRMSNTSSTGSSVGLTSGLSISRSESPRESDEDVATSSKQDGPILTEEPDQATVESLSLAAAVTEAH